MVNIFAWNCQGAGHDMFISDFQSFFIPMRLEIVVIVEPHIGKEVAKGLVPRTGFDGVLMVDAIGFAGGIWVLWDEQVLQVNQLDAWE
ncbi:unnamed protein product [Linum trigynum]|uniref:Uncharacterized protein n=1 Tax=Linum trigynum TaxID=586398 RepID=A0AAV2E5T5_9ROSI